MMPERTQYHVYETQSSVELAVWLNSEYQRGYRLAFAPTSRAIRGGDGWLVAVVELQ